MLDLVKEKQKVVQILNTLYPDGEVYNLSYYKKLYDKVHYLAQTENINVKQWIEKQGLKYRKRKIVKARTNSLRSKLPKEVLLKMVEEQRFTFQKIANLYGVSRQAIHQLYKYYKEH
ncbi:hypothetical protein [Caloranaerobacter sp. DY30410]|uniref:hypothetical protein n=1 Tax=Caloranaerobacter sp. DY30410 TaxID=3238305 RepID=UPI003D06F345